MPCAIGDSCEICDTVLSSGIALGGPRTRAGDPQLANLVERWSGWVGDGQTRGDKAFSATVGAALVGVGRRDLTWAHATGAGV